MENRALKLQIAKGPRQGDELEFKSGSRIRIGRVVRGNNVVIKDAGISSKHLSIELDPKSGAWILQDLGSSNGTIINGSSDVLSPNTPYSIKDGDSIKIGESTSILVILDDSCVVEQVSELPPLNPRRRGRPAAGKRKLKEQNYATGVSKEAEKNAKAAGVLKEAADEIVKEDGVLKEAPRVSPRRTRSRVKRAVDETGEDNCEEKKSNLGKRTRASSMRKQNEEKDAEKLNPVVISAGNVEEEETGQHDQMSNDNLTEPNGPPLDLAKLTMREFFDYLEKNISKQIIAETDKSLAAMREKVELVKEYVREQRKKATIGLTS